MMAHDPVDRERALALMMNVLDGEGPATAREELDALIRRHPDLQAEWDRLRRVKEVTSTMALRHPPEEVWDRYWLSVYNRAERGVAWILVSVGAVIVLGWGLWQALGDLLADTGLPAIVRGGTVALALGLLILVVSVARERWVARGRDPYSKEVTR